MSTDIYFSAAKKDGNTSDDSAYFFFSRAQGIGNCILSYFAEFIPAEYDKRDTARAYPKYRITLNDWTRLMHTLSDEEELLRYLADYVLSVFSFDEYVPEEYRDFENIDVQKLVRFARWFSRVFHLNSTLRETNEIIFPDQRNCERIAADAYALIKWQRMDQTVREYLLDSQYEVYIGIG